MAYLIVYRKCTSKKASLLSVVDTGAFIGDFLHSVSFLSLHGSSSGSRVVSRDSEDNDNDIILIFVYRNVKASRPHVNSTGHK